MSDCMRFFKFYIFYFSSLSFTFIVCSILPTLVNKRVH